MWRSYQKSFLLFLIRQPLLRQQEYLCNFLFRDQSQLVLSQVQSQSVRILLESAKISDELLKKYADILGKPDFRTALLHEAMTGTGKFKGGAKSPAVPNYLLEWDINDPTKSEYAEITDDLVNKKMKFTLLRISDRGDKRGGAFRSDAKDKEVKSYFNEQALAKAHLEYFSSILPVVRFLVEP